MEENKEKDSEKEESVTEDTEETQKDIDEDTLNTEEKELEVIVHGKIDLRKVPKEIFDAFIAALEEDICNVAEKERNNDNIS